MTQKEMLARLMRGEVALIGSYWAGKEEKIYIRDKTTGKGRDAYILRETLLTDADPVAVGGFLPDDYKPGSWKPGFKRGDRVVCFTTGLKTVQGFKQYAGTLEPLAD